MTQTPHTKWLISIEQWSAWQFNPLTQELPDISFIDVSLRRKLSLLAKMSLKVAHDCASNYTNVRMVFASRHGDLAKTTQMLTNLAMNEAPSPTAFSMSVLNASAGVYSITKKDTAPSVAVSASESSFGFGLLEAHLQLASDPSVPVLFVYADEMPPELYEVNEASFTPHAIGLLLTNNAPLKVECELSDANYPTSLAPQSIAFLECLNNRHAVSWCDNGKLWNWQHATN
ncbi:MAG TPA: beta-ketoacyl synthase chain length factor [Methylotenera sp.]|nr:beta-ketoacyl synthase chain length factor [Methylotenera sp.]